MEQRLAFQIEAFFAHQEARGPINARPSMASPRSCSGLGLAVEELLASLKHELAG